MISYENYKKRIAIIHAIRTYFDTAGYLELDTPLLSPALIPEAHIAIHRTTFDAPAGNSQELYLLPSPEYYIKQLLSMQSWQTPVYQLGKCFRNAETLEQYHSPEFTMLEYYTLDATYHDSMHITEELINFLFEEKLCDPKVEHLKGPFDTITMHKAFELYAASNLYAYANISDEHDALCAIKDEARRLHISYNETESWDTIFYRIFIDCVEPHLLIHPRPIALFDYPARCRTLSRKTKNTPWTQRWELYMCGMEIANCFSEETNSSAITKFFHAEMQALAQSGTQINADIEYAQKIHSLPHSSGVALGIDRLIMALLNIKHITDTQLFPLHETI